MNALDTIETTKTYCMHKCATRTSITDSLEKWGPPILERSPQQFLRKAKVLDYAHCKNENQKGKIPTVLVTAGNLMGGESTSLTNPEKGRAGKRKTNNAGHPRNDPTGKKKFMITRHCLDLG